MAKRLQDILYLNESRWNFEPIKAKNMDDYRWSVLSQSSPKDIKKNPKEDYYISHYQKLPSGNHSGVASTEILKGHQFIKKMKKLEYPVGYFHVQKANDFISRITSTRSRNR